MSRRLEAVILPATLSVVLHALLLFVLTANWEPERDPTIRKVPRHVNAKLVTLDKTAAKPKQAKPRPPEPKPEPPKPKPEPPKPKPEPKPSPKPAPKKEQPKPDPKKLEEARKKDQQKKADEERRQRQREMELSMAMEEETQQAESDTDLAMAYTDAIRGAIEDNWSRPPSARREMEVVLRLQLIPTGEVVSVSVVKSSGNEAFDTSAINAVKKAARFPEVADAPQQVFERHLRSFQLVFRPEDLRL
jgi:colicin import membrane protein